MANRAWPDGPTWEEIVQRTVRKAAARVRYNRALYGYPDLVTVALRDSIAELSLSDSAKLCRACGFDATTGEKLEDER